MTFQFLKPVKKDWVTDIAIVQGGDPYKHRAYYGWATPWDSRTELNTGGHFPMSVENAIKEVVKWSYKNNSEKQVSTNDKVFFLSLYELNIYTTLNIGSGTGPSHDQPYLFYQQSGNSSIGYIDDWCWTRTIRENNEYDLWLVQGEKARQDGGSNRVQSQWLPAFCM